MPPRCPALSWKRLCWRRHAADLEGRTTSALITWVLPRLVRRPNLRHRQHGHPKVVKRVMTARSALPVAAGALTVTLPKPRHRH